MCVDICKCASGLDVRGKVWTSKVTRFGIFDNPNNSLIRTELGTGLYGLARFYCTTFFFMSSGELLICVSKLYIRKR